MREACDDWPRGALVMLSSKMFCSEMLIGNVKNVSGTWLSYSGTLWYAQTHFDFYFLHFSLRPFREVCCAQWSVACGHRDRDGERVPDHDDAMQLTPRARFNAALIICNGRAL